MPRFSLREFSRPDYASSLPKKDPNNAIWPRTSMLAKMLNEIPWFKKSAQDELSSYMGWDFTYETATPEQLMEIQKLLKAGGYDIGETGVGKDGIDGVRGSKTLAAYIDYNKKLKGSLLWNKNHAPDEEQESATFANELEEANRWSGTMDGDKPNTTGGQ